MKISQIVLLIFLLMVTPVFADGIVTLSDYSLVLLPIVIFIEILVFWLFNKKIYNKKIDVKKIVSVISLANIASFLIGLIFYYDLYKISGLSLKSIHEFVSAKTLFGFFVYFAVSVIIEFFVFLLILRKSFKIKDLLVICIIVNVFSYAFIYSLFTIGSYTIPQRNLEQAKSQGCTAVRGDCYADTTIIKIQPVYLNNGGIVSDTLQKLCENEYNIPVGEKKTCLNKVCGMSC